MTPLTIGEEDSFVCRKPASLTYEGLKEDKELRCLPGWQVDALNIIFIVTVMLSLLCFSFGGGGCDGGGSVSRFRFSSSSQSVGIQHIDERRFE